MRHSEKMQSKKAPEPDTLDGHRSVGTGELALPPRASLHRSALKLLPRRFFDAPPDEVAPALLGKILAHCVHGRLLAGRIVEVEAYLGQGDSAAHSAIGRTARNAVLFGPPGHAYVYHIYGMHQCVNVSCLPDGIAGCVLMRALDPLDGVDAMLHNRGLAPDAPLRNIASGPGKICQALAISRDVDNGRDLTSTESPLVIYDDNFRCGEIVTTTRIGVHKSTDRPLRFYLAGNVCISHR